jgi:hypothetical protein
MSRLSAAALVCLALALAARGARADQNEELANKLSNPVADLISVPFQGNVDYDIGPTNDGTRYLLNIQPVIPINLGPDWNLISRTILPVVHWSKDVVPSDGTRFGLGDTTQSFFLSPAKPGDLGIIWGFGPALLLPTATEGSSLGTQKWAAGPTAVLLKQKNGVTAGLLANHLWSFAGKKSRSQVSQTFFQPFLSYTTRTATSFTVNLESSYNWQTSRWTIPANFMVSQVLKLGPQIASFQLGYRSYVSAPSGGPKWGLRFAVILLFPK